MKLVIAALLFLILAAADVVAETYTEKVFDSWTYAGNSYNTTVGERFNVISYYEYVVDVDFEDAGEFFIREGDCAEKNNLKVCFESSEFSHYNYTVPDRRVYKLKLAAYEVVPKIELLRKIERETLIVGQGSKILSTIKNPSSQQAKVFFSDSINETSVKVSLNCECIIKEGNVTWSGTINPGQEKALYYEIVGLRNSTFISTASAEYFDGIKNSRVQDTKTIKVESPFTLNLAVDKTANLKGSLSANVSLYSSMALRAYFRLKVPDGLAITGWKRIDGLDREENMFTYSKELTSGHSDNFSIQLSATQPGEHKLSAEAEVTVDSYKYSFDEYADVSVTYEKPRVQATVKNISSSTNSIMLVFVNPSGFTYEDVSITLSGLPLNKSRYSYSELGPGKSQTEAQEFGAEPGSYYINVTILFTLEGRRLSSSEIIRITVGDADGSAEHSPESSEQYAPQANISEEQDESDLLAIAQKEINNADASDKRGVMVAAAAVLAVTLIATPILLHIKKKRQNSF